MVSKPLPTICSFGFKYLGNKCRADLKLLSDIPAEPQSLCGFLGFGVASGKATGYTDNLFKDSRGGVEASPNNSIHWFQILFYDLDKRTSSFETFVGVPVDPWAFEKSPTEVVKGLCS